MIDIRIRKPNDTYSCLIQSLCTPFIIFPAGLLIVLSSINFYHKFSGWAVKIRNITIKRLLSHKPRR